MANHEYIWVREEEMSAIHLHDEMIAELLNILRPYDQADKLKNPAVLYLMGVRNKSYLKSASLSIVKQGWLNCQSFCKLNNIVVSYESQF